MVRAGCEEMFDKSFWMVFLTIAILGIAVCVAILEHNYHLRIHNTTRV